MVALKVFILHNYSEIQEVNEMRKQKWNVLRTESCNVFEDDDICFID